MTRLEVDDLRVEIAGRGVDIVAEVSFAIGAGEVLGLVGESGAGKSTVGLALLGQARRGARIRSGRVILDGRDILALRDAELRPLRGSAVAYVPQDPASALNPALRVRTQLQEVLDGGRASARESRMRALLAEVLLPSDAGFLGRYPHQLSGGQQQRLMLAMALARRPRVIVLDEPTTGLDVTTEAHVVTTVRRLCATYGVAALYTSHDLAVIANVASRVAVMYAGRIVEQGPADTLFRAAAHPYTRGLVASVPALSGRHVPVGVAGDSPRPDARPSGCSFSPRCSFAVDECAIAFPPTESVGALREVRCYRAADVIAAERPTLGRVPERVRSNEDTLVRVRGLDASHGRQQVLFGIDLTVNMRQCVALVGESGSGKTTLARSIVGLHRNFTGEVALRGRSLSKDARRRDRTTKRELQYVFQSPYTSLNPRKTVGQLVGQPLRLFFRLDRRETENRITAALERVRLSTTVVPRYPRELSGGERQRVAIARALAAEPVLLICDEITSALDVSVQAAIIELLIELRRETRLSLLFVTHDLALARTLADSVAVLHTGRIVEFAPTEGILDAPQHPYTQSLVADVPSIERRWTPSANDLFPQHPSRMRPGPL